MTTATIENEPVSIQLENSSTTVPSNEIWKVTISGAAVRGGNGDFPGNSNLSCKINGTVVASSDANTKVDGRPEMMTTFPFDTVLVGSDVIEAAGNDGIQIGGFVVNTNYSP